MKRHTINTERGRFHYREYGESGKPVAVLLHGYPQSGRCWDEVANLLSDHYFLIVPDLRGLGDSNRDLRKELYGKDQLAKDIIGLLDQLGIGTFMLVGHDWGGAVAQEIAYAIPARIHKLTLLNFPVLQNRKGQQKAYEKLGQYLFKPFWYQFFMSYPQLPEAFMAGNEAFWIRFCCRGLTNSIPEDAIQEYIRCYQIEGTITTGANYYRTMREDFKRWATAAFAKSRHPMDTLIIHGEKDQVVVKDYFEDVDSCFENVDIKYVDAGHFVMDEQPEVVAEHLRAFWTDQRNFDPVANRADLD